MNPNTYQVQSAFADVISSMLNLSGIESFSTGKRIFTDRSVYIIVQDCLGWKSMAIFLALIWASTKRTLEYANYIILGLAVLILANLIRVFSTVYLAEAGIMSFQVIHGFLWRWSLTAVVLVLWLYWLKNRKEEARFNARIKEHLDDISLE